MSAPPLHFQEFLALHREQVLARWEGLARSIPAAKRLPREGLRDGIPRVLDEVARAIAERRSCVSDAPAEHTRQRWYEGYSVEEIVEEYSLLREALIAEWSARSSGGVPDDEAAFLHRTLDSAIGDAVNAHANACRASLAEGRADLADARSSRERLGAAIERAPFGVAVLDAEGRHVMVNAAWMQQTRLTAEDAVGKTGAELWGTPESVEATHAQIEAIRAGRGIPTNDYSHVEGDTLRHYRWAMFPIEGVGSLPLGGVAFTWEVTAEVESAKQRDAALARLDAVIAQMSEAVIVVGADGRVETMNDAAKSMRGAAIAELPIARWPEALGLETTGGEPVKAEDLPIARALRGERTERVTLIGRRPDGRPFAAECSAAPLTGVGGARMGAVVIGRDVTKEREESALRERFVHILAHDLRNPLHAMAVNAALVARRASEPERVVELAARLERTTDKMTRMVVELLDLARAEHPEGIRVELRPEDVGRIVKETIDLLFPEPPESPLVLHVAPGCVAAVDADRFSQALENLLRNAISHGAKGAPIDVTVRRKDGDVVVSVHNDGPPIAPEDLPHVFEPYRRARAKGSIALPNGGLGLGLYVVGTIVAAHGGTVSARSSEEEGTELTIRLPAAA